MLLVVPCVFVFGACGKAPKTESLKMDDGTYYVASVSLNGGYFYALESIDGLGFGGDLEGIWRGLSPYFPTDCEKYVGKLVPRFISQYK